MKKIFILFSICFFCLGADDCGLDQYHPKPDVLVIMMDDTRKDGMPGLDTLAEEGVKFTNATTVTPHCGPSRAAFFTGNPEALLVNGFTDFDDDFDSLAIRLQARGYETGLFGTYVPGVGGADYRPGWNEWLARDSAMLYFGSIYKNKTGQTIQASQDIHEIDFLLDKIIEFLENSSGPTFAYWAPLASHTEGFTQVIKAPTRYVGALNGLPSHTPGNLDQLPSPPPPHFNPPAGNSNAIRQQAMESTLAVTEAITVLRQMFPDLIIILTSDNGVGWGEHRLHFQAKNCPWIECLAVPLVVWGPYPVHEVTVPVQVHDVGHTVLAITGASQYEWGGESLIALLNRATQPIPNRISLNYIFRGTFFPSPKWEATYNFQTGETFIEWDYDFLEYYNLNQDPWQLNNLQ